jgi:hypothetical protein
MTGKYYFSIPPESITHDAGWYIIRAGNDDKPIYVGKAKDLNHHLNTKDGTRDNFANHQRGTDDARNIIKKLVMLGAIAPLSVYIVPAQLLCQKVGLTPLLPDRELGNVEKVLNLFRSNLLA